jgi:sigma-B regulation protein RsbU (phosphoserine phosphatase)
MQGDILLEVTGNEQELKFVLKDSGVPFDPTAYKEVDAMLYAESQTIGGLGIHLMRHYTDGMSYERTDGHNVLTMIKKLKNNKE